MKEFTCCKARHGDVQARPCVKKTRFVYLTKKACIYRVHCIIQAILQKVNSHLLLKLPDLIAWIITTPTPHCEVRCQSPRAAYINKSLSMSKQSVANLCRCGFLLSHPTFRTSSWIRFRGKMRHTWHIETQASCGPDKTSEHSNIQTCEHVSVPRNQCRIREQPLILVHWCWESDSREPACSQSLAVQRELYQSPFSSKSEQHQVPGTNVPLQIVLLHYFSVALTTHSKPCRNFHPKHGCPELPGAAPKPYPYESHNVKASKQAKECSSLQTSEQLTQASITCRLQPKSQPPNNNEQYLALEVTWRCHEDHWIVTRLLHPKSPGLICHVVLGWPPKGSVARSKKQLGQSAPEHPWEDPNIMSILPFLVLSSDHWVPCHPNRPWKSHTVEAHVAKGWSNAWLMNHWNGQTSKKFGHASKKVSSFSERSKKYLQKRMLLKKKTHFKHSRPHG